MENRLNVTSVPTIIFLDIVGFSKKPNTEQISIKERLNSHIQTALNGIPESNRILLDTGDGAGIAIWDTEPQRPLYVAIAIRDAILESNKSVETQIHVRFGIHSGPVTVTLDFNNRYNIVGDGINVTQRIMSFAGENQIMVSRSYYDNIFGIDTAINNMLIYHGVNADKHSRQHEVYLLVSPNDIQITAGADKKWKRLFRTQSKKVNAISSRVNSIAYVVGVLSLITAIIVLTLINPEWLSSFTTPSLSHSQPEISTSTTLPSTSLSSQPKNTQAPSTSSKIGGSSELSPKLKQSPVVHEKKSKHVSNDKEEYAEEVVDSPSDKNLYDGGYLTKSATGEQVILYGEAAEEAISRDSR